MMIKILYKDVDSVHYIFLIKMIKFQTIQIADGFAKKNPLSTVFSYSPPHPKRPVDFVTFHP